MGTLFLVKCEIQVIAQNKDMVQELLEKNIKSKRHDENYGLIGIINYGIRKHGE